ncbi:hypothetical protein [Ornithinimicrobium sediminis]|uniref:hypothetical protein n=1 Tax=Ornithinimicrobium sediminis TaxID=2904603 RepID=UPI001E45AEFB|nr:hypothetical protein [Ornithinimicrobium sediminis]MCE0486373.1 hypothetical protein [Ornithinimicrobium sediminis]
MLGVQDDSAAVMRGLAIVASLLRDLERRVDSTNSQEVRDIFDQHWGAWASPVFTPGLLWKNASETLVDNSSLVALNGLSFTLAVAAPDGPPLPDPEVTADLAQSLRDLEQLVQEASDLGEDLRALLLRRIADILWTLEHVDIVGPGGVRDGVAGLAGEVAIHVNKDPSSVSNPLLKRLMLIAGVVWAVFTGVPEAQDAWDDWAAMVPVMSLPTEVPEPSELPTYPLQAALPPGRGDLEEVSPESRQVPEDEDSP